MDLSVSRLTLRLSSFYLFYFATLGVILPYWSLYLQSLGLAPARIGELLAVVMATKLIAPNVWGWIADHSGKRMRMVRFAVLAALLSFTGIYVVNDTFAGLALVMLFFSFFWNAALPQFEAVTLNHLGKQTHRYSHIRLWGSVGFIGMAMTMGELLQYLNIGIVPAVLLGLFLGLWLISLTVPEQVANPVLHQPILGVLCQPPVLALFGVCFLIQASHGPYYAFFSIYLEDLGYRSGFIGGLWGLGVIAEVGIFLLMHRLLPRFGPRYLLLTALALTTLRWLLIGSFADQLFLLLFAQTLHAFSFGLYHAVSIHLIHRFFTGAHQGRGQALYSSVSFGAGGALGNLAAGYLWADFSPTIIYTLAAATSVLGWIVAWRWLRV